MTAVSGAGLSCRELVSLRYMLEINGQAFMAAVQEMRRVQVVMEQEAAKDYLREKIADDVRPVMDGRLANMAQAATQLHAKVTMIAINRLRLNLTSNQNVTWQEIKDGMSDIASRLNDELGLVKLFVLDGTQSLALQPGNLLLGQDVADRYPSMVFEVEEAAKCLALGRSTASAFHSMRALEVAIKGLAAFLGVADPVIPAQKNWAIVLKEIKAAIDAKYPAKARMSGSEGAAIEALYASLDAMKNPWRNATMHTENVYQPHEASHILQCLNVFVVKLALICDENGDLVGP